MEFKFGKELIKALYAIRNAIKGESGEGNNNDDVENDYIKFIQPVGILHVDQSGMVETLSGVFLTIDEYMPKPINDDGRLSGDANNSYSLIYNRADIENGINNKFECGYYSTNNNKHIRVYFNHGDIAQTIPLNEALSMIKPNESNPEFDEINVSDITESNLENFVVVVVEFPINK